MACLSPPQIDEQKFEHLSLAKVKKLAISPASVQRHEDMTQRCEKQQVHQEWLTVTTARETRRLFFDEIDFREIKNGTNLVQKSCRSARYY